MKGLSRLKTRVWQPLKFVNKAQRAASAKFFSERVSSPLIGFDSATGMRHLNVTRAGEQKRFWNVTPRMTVL
jgi:hypothetical protein